MSYPKRAAGLDTMIVVRSLLFFHNFARQCTKIVKSSERRSCFVL